MTDPDLAWAAGFLEGEGSFDRGKTRYRIRHRAYPPRP